MMRTFWLLVLYGARRLCPKSQSSIPVFPLVFSIAGPSARDCGATYVGESVGRHRGRFPGESVGNCLQCCEQGRLRMARRVVEKIVPESGRWVSIEEEVWQHDGNKTYHWGAVS